jgi:deferrochelatase/peroxidase EfeB
MPLPPFSRRRFLGAVGGLAAGGAVAAGSELTASGSASESAAGIASIEPFFGLHQGGIATSAQSHTYFAALDVTSERRNEVADLFRSWTHVASNLTSGRTAEPLSADADLPEPDAGDAVGLAPARLTVNFGFGPGFFGSGSTDRFGLAEQRPIWLVDLPAFRGDEIVPSDTGGDLTVQACADDPQVAFHAVRQLVRAAEGVATIRWSQDGYNESAAFGGTPRNLLGFKDGTINPTTGPEMDEFVWVGHEGPSWITGGTYLIVRRIRISLDAWDRTSLRDQQQVIGRYKLSGAPLGKTNEFDSLDLTARGANGQPVIPVDSHVRLASPQENWGQMLLRRNYAYAGAADSSSGLSRSAGSDPTFDAGVLFFCYQRNPRLAFIPIFRKLAANDSLSRFTTHTASAIAAIPPAAPGRGRYVAQPLLEE